MDLSGGPMRWGIRAIAWQLLDKLLKGVLFVLIGLG